MAGSAVMFGLMGFFARLASVHTSWTIVAAARGLIGALVALAIARARGASITVRDRRGIWGRSLFGTGAMACIFYAFASPAITLGDAATLTNLTPVVLAVIAPKVLQERTGRRVMIGLPLSLAGIVLILRPAMLFGHHASGPGALFASLIAVLGAILSAFAMLMLRRLGPSESPEAVAIHFSFTSSAILSIVALPHLAWPSAGEALAILGAGVSAGLGQIAMTRAYALERAARVSGLAYLAIVVSALLGALALGEWPVPLALWGMALVVAGGLVVTVAGLRDANG
jgi:drug/metabolite transporter (DMT)-like permease